MIKNAYCRCSVVKTYTGHGCGNLFHCAPTVPHYANNKVRYISLITIIAMLCYIRLIYELTLQQTVCARLLKIFPMNEDC